MSVNFKSISWSHEQIFYFLSKNVVSKECLLEDQKKVCELISRAQTLVNESYSLGRKSNEIKKSRELKVEAIRIIHPIYDKLDLSYEILSEIFGKSPGWFTYWFRAANVKAKNNIPRKPFHPTTYECNEGAFDNWSAEMAYWLGFIWADGHVQDVGGRRHLRLAVCEFDSKHLTLFQKFMSTNAPIKIKNYRSKKGGEYFPQAVICIYRKNIVRALQGYNVNASRSVNGAEYPEIPDEYIWDFLRGLFDGDGAIYKHQSCNFFCSGWIIGFFGSKKCMEFLRDFILKETGILMVLRLNGKSLTNYSLTRSGPAILPVLRRLYPEDIHLGLARKILPARFLGAFFKIAESYGVEIHQRGDGLRFCHTEKLPFDLGDFMAKILAGDPSILQRPEFISQPSS